MFGQQKDLTLSVTWKPQVSIYILFHNDSKTNILFSDIVKNLRLIQPIWILLILRERERVRGGGGGGTVGQAFRKQRYDIKGSDCTIHPQYWANVSNFSFRKTLTVLPSSDLMNIEHFKMTADKSTVVTAYLL